MNRTVPPRLLPATTPEDIEQVRTLFREYQAALGVDLCFQGFEGELAGLPGAYAPPAGRLVLARMEAEVAGCVALRPLARSSCEMKRLYVRPQFRGSGLGGRLARHVVAEARAIGYRRLCLDTLPVMAAAHELYRSLGFREIEPYYPTPLPGTLFLGLDLAT